MSRERFEEWWAHTFVKSGNALILQNNFERYQDGEYATMAVQRAWLAYQAGEASRQPEIDELMSFVIAVVDGNATYETEYDGVMYTHCRGCDAELTSGEAHDADCLLIRARALIAKHKGEA